MFENDHPAASGDLSSPACAPFIKVRGLVAGYGGKVIVEDVSFDVGPREHLSLLGPSGCGKSTTLRCIAGLETPLDGEITIGKQVVFSAAKRINLAPEKRRLAMVFQSYAIWPHMSVFENVAYGLRSKGTRGDVLEREVNHALEMVNMREFGSRRASELSGGQQQRVALARAYAVRPQAILLDEPLSNLDARLRVHMREELRELQRQTDLSTIYVTHDQEEAMAISNRIIVMRDGQIEQIGAPLDIYDRPRTRFVADFIGAANVMEATIVDGTPEGETTLAVGDTEILSSMPALPRDGKHPIIVRSVYAKLRLTPFEHGCNVWPAKIEKRSLLGDLVAYTVSWPGGSLRVTEFPTDIMEEGAQVYLHIPKDKVVVVED